MPQLHLPVQSGSDRMLAAMNRRHSRADYLRVIERLRAARPDLAFSSDFIVGFPGESEEDFGDTLRLVAEVGYASAFSFKYSPRPGTPAADMEQVAGGREGRAPATPASRDRPPPGGVQWRAALGATFDVLFEKPGRKPGQIVGRSPYLQPVQVMAPADADRRDRRRDHHRGRHQQPVRRARARAAHRPDTRVLEAWEA